MTASSPDDDIVSLDAIALSQAIQTRDVSCVEVLNAYLAHIDRINPAVNAIVAMQDRAVLHTLATERDTQLSRGENLGPLHGFPQAPKDILPVAGMVTTKGSPIYANEITRVDAVVFERMRKAGAIFIGRTNSPEFGLGGHTYNPVYGTTRNAFEPSRSAGGSSGGAAVSVALRMLPCADGSDMMGSLRTPAAFNNVFGFRTTPGCVPYAPSDDVFFQQFSVAGPIARNIPDLGLLLSVQSGFDARAPLSRRSDKPADFANALDRDMRGTRIGWLGDLNGHLPMEAGLMDTYTSALHHFETVGCTIETARIDFDLDRLWNAWLDLRSLTFSGTNAPLYRDAAKRKLLKPEAVWEIERGLKLSGEDVSRAIRERAAWYQAINAQFDNFDYLLMPSAQVFPFDAELDWPHAIAGREMDSYHRWMEAVVPATMASLPALSAPAGFGPGGLPAGLQIIGPTQGDLGVLQLGLAYDRASGFSSARSPLLG
ncbi:amidase [Caballeronia novacaledonica]|uniref:Amidase n=1 Tax=Caballeronia novacaledonica TaxID=1544861 RepID=A0AA37MS34_9BURK|nr:amidase [Caballeronia novacaledonica]GJH29146.1 amidase [Caballeronia novacaledonica]